MLKQDKLKDYDSDPVTYCSKCYSLNIRHDDDIDLDYCGECGCTDFQTSLVVDWEKLFAKRYGHKFVEASYDIKKTPIFMMPMDKLKSMVYNDSSWRDICTTMYPSFPGGLSKADSVILLFAKLVQENRLDDLRIELINRNYKNNKYGRE